MSTVCDCVCAVVNAALLNSETFKSLAETKMSTVCDCVCAVVNAAVLNSETFRSLTETKMSAAVAEAMNYLTKRGKKCR